MLKLIFISSFMFFLLISCQKENVIELFNYERDTPEWLKAKIDSMSNHQDYYGTKVFRHEWKAKYIYHIVIPVSSCGYCDVYDQNGNKLQFANDNEFQDYLKNRKNEILVWEWNK